MSSFMDVNLSSRLSIFLGSFAGVRCNRQYEFLVAEAACLRHINFLKLITISYDFVLKVIINYLCL